MSTVGSPCACPYNKSPSIRAQNVKPMILLGTSDIDLTSRPKGPSTDPEAKAHKHHCGSYLDPKRTHSNGSKTPKEPNRMILHTLWVQLL